ncbi:UNVERIFIED_CONTAM: E3 ubiquitin-protein ligase RING1-like [Sesamum radiatum]|uniref:E3 ubiquitin-protein ligase RING1-like n=1 Tax=Sesamum radiatum TaxID=300843 RepID=A0AAW2R769_SESRA
MACAICKDSFTVGAVVNQLPCFSPLPPFCISPWLNTRNTCPLCRYEMPTDDKDYEARKRNEGNEYDTLLIHQHDVNDDSSLDATYDGVMDEPSQLHHGREQREVLNADSVG